jgi:hypothetical protein
MTGKGFFAKVFGTTDEQVEKDLEDIILYDIDSSGYKEVDHQPLENNNCKWCPFYKTHHCSATFQN